MLGSQSLSLFILFMSALESVISQRLKEFSNGKPYTLGLRARLSALRDRFKALNNQPTGVDLGERHRVQAEIRELRLQIEDLEKPTDEELDYIMQVGYLLRNMEREGPDAEEAQGQKDFYGCTVTVEKHKGYAFKKYMAHVEQRPDFQEQLYNDLIENKKRQPDLCPACSCSHIVLTNDGGVCTQCGLIVHDIIFDTSNFKNMLTYEQQSNDVVVVYNYNRMNHLNEWISKLQAREMTPIPGDVLDAIKLELKKARISSPIDITQKRVKEILKKLKLSKFYDHVPNITNLLTGAEVSKFPTQLEQKLRNMFEMIQEPFRLYCPKNRKNFLHYGYVLYKFCELLGEDKYLKFIPMLKSFEKLYLQDQIWKKICGHLRWEFIASV